MWGIIATTIATSVGGGYAKTLALIIFVLPMVVGMIIKLLGIAFFTYVGVDIALTYITDLIYAQFSGLPSDMLMLMNLAGADTALKMVISTAGAALTLKAFSSTKKFKFLA